MLFSIASPVSVCASSAYIDVYFGRPFFAIPNKIIWKKANKTDVFSLIGDPFFKIN